MLKPRIHYNEKVTHVHLEGDPKKHREPGEVWIHFPGGSIGVSRTTDNEYWAHMTVNSAKEVSNGYAKEIGQATDQRIDCTGIHVNDADLGSLTRDDLYHMAMKITVKRD